LKGNLIEWSSFNSLPPNNNRAVFIFIHSKKSRLSLKMENEIFTDGRVADILNMEFTNIKIDRYIDTDLFKYYRNLYKLMNRRDGNEPICIFATESLEPFYATGYMPKSSRGDILGFRELLDIVLDKYRVERDTLIETGKEIIGHLNRKESKIQATKFDLNILNRTLKLHIEELFDKRYGGFGDEIKFLNSSVLDLMLSLDGEERDLALFTLKSMAEGGIFNSKWFYRYGTESWDYATSESLNYQNGLMAKVYIRAYEISKDSTFKDVATNILDNIEVEGLTSLDSIIADALLYGARFDSRYLTRALSILDTILSERYINRVLYHIDGIDGYLEDFAYLGLALLNSYRISGSGDYLIFSQNILNLAIETLYEGGRWRFSNRIELYEDIYDIDYPSSISIIVELMEQIMEFVEEDYSSIISRTLQINSYSLMRQPLSSPNLAKVLRVHLKGEKRC